MMNSGDSLAFQRLSRDTLKFILSVRVAEVPAQPYRSCRTADRGGTLPPQRLWAPRPPPRSRTQGPSFGTHVLMARPPAPGANTSYLSICPKLWARPPKKMSFGTALSCCRSVRISCTVSCRGQG
eukprot:gene9761-biopygen21261